MIEFVRNENLVKSTKMRLILLSFLYFKTVTSYDINTDDKGHQKILFISLDESKSSSTSESEEKSNPLNNVDGEDTGREMIIKKIVPPYHSNEKRHPKLLLATFIDELINYKSSSSSESEEKPHPLYYADETDNNIARAWASSCDKNAHLWCKRACKKALDLTCSDFPEQCTSNFKKTLIEDCRAECRYEFDSTFDFNSYVRPKPHKNGANKNGKEKNGKDKNGKDKNGKDKNGKDKNGKDKNGKDKNGKDKNGNDKNGKDKNGEDKNGKDNNGNDKKGENKKDKDNNGNDKKDEDKKDEDKKDEDKKDEDKKDEEKKDEEKKEE